MKLPLKKTLLLLSLFISFNVYAIQDPKYSQIKKLSNHEVETQLEEFVGTKDTWRYNTSLFDKLKIFLPFKKKTTIDEDRINLSYIHARKNPQSLQQLVLASQNSQHEQIRGIVVTVLGDKALVLDNYINTPGYDLRSLLYFFKTLDIGDTGLETKKFNEFSLAFDSLAYNIKRAYQKSAALSLPMVLEFESSALTSKSPLTKLLFNTIINDRSQVLKVEITPDGGRIVSIHPFYARDIAKSMDLFANQFSKKVRTLRGSLFRDPEAKQREPLDR